MAFQFFSGKVTRTVDALDGDTWTLRTEVQVAYLDNALRPGMDLQLKFVLENRQSTILDLKPSGGELR